MPANSSGVLANSLVYFVICYCEVKLNFKTGSGCCVF